MTITVSNDLLEATSLTEQEIRLELALALYASGKLSFARARRLADMDETPFNNLLFERGIMMPYTMEDWEKELETIESFPLSVK
jgi:predicted HTH domain antitoxin